MIYQIMKYLNNFFVREGEKGYYGTFTIEDGYIDLPDMLEGRYFLIEGSALNDGVYMYPVSTLRDEVFTGYVTPLSPDPEFLTVVCDIENWCNEYEAKTASPFASESFGGYSYSRATNSKGNAISWKDQFRERLSVWRKR